MSSTTVSPPHTSASTFSNRAEFERLVRALTESSAGSSFGRLHIVSIKPMLPDSDWQRLLPKAANIAEHILHERLQASDSCLMVTPGQYLLVFSNLNETESRIRAAAIATEIKLHLVGTSDSDLLDVATEILPLSLLRSAGPDLSVDTMRTALETGHAPQGIQLSVELQPVWDGDGQAIIGNRARLRRDFNDQVMYESAGLFGGDQDPLAVEANTRLAQAGGTFPRDHGMLFLPVALNNHTLAAPRGLHPFLETATLGGRRDIVVELAGAVSSLGRPALRDTIATIRTHGCRVAVRMVPERETAKFVHDCGAEFICLNQTQARQAGFTPSAMYALYTMVAHDVGDLGFTLCLWNAAMAEDIKRATALGFRYVSGTPVGATSLTAAMPRPLPARQMFA